MLFDEATAQVTVHAVCGNAHGYMRTKGLNMHKSDRSENQPL